MNLILNPLKGTSLSLAIRENIFALTSFRRLHCIPLFLFIRTLAAINFIQVVSKTSYNFSYNHAIHQVVATHNFRYSLVIITIQNLFNQLSLLYMCISITIHHKILLPSCSGSSCHHHEVNLFIIMTF